MSLGADHLIARRPRLGPIMTAYHPEVSILFAEHSAALGFVPKSVERQWAALAQVCALHAVTPNAVTRQMLDASHTALEDAAVRLGVRRHDNRHAILFGLQASLFHSGSATSRPSPGPAGPPLRGTAGRTCPPCWRKP